MTRISSEVFATRQPTQPVAVQPNHAEVETKDKAPSFERATHSIAAIDGHPIVVNLYSPSAALRMQRNAANAPQIRGAVLIAPAMGVAQRFYAPIASWLASQGFVTLTFDFRGIGESKVDSLSTTNVNVIDWARLDATAALRWLQDQAGDIPITWLGHSLGGQIVPFVPDHPSLAKIITVATGSGYWRENAPELKWKVPLLWYGLVPALVPVFGYFPGKKLGMVGNIPGRVMQQWRKWCMHPEYAVGSEGEATRQLFSSVRTPLTAISFSDDEMMSAKNVASIHSFYNNAAVELLRFDPPQLNADRIGHFGWFRAEHEASWAEVLLPRLAVIPEQSAGSTPRC